MHGICVRGRMHCDRGNAEFAAGPLYAQRDLAAIRDQDLAETAASLLSFRIRVGKKRKQFFFEKKNQKTFTRFEYSSWLAVASTKQTKVFCFFFSKKKYFLASPVQ